MILTLWRLMGTLNPESLNAVWVGWVTLGRLKVWKTRGNGAVGNVFSSCFPSLISTGSGIGLRFKTTEQGGHKQPHVFNSGTHPFFWSSLGLAIL